MRIPNIGKIALALSLVSAISNSFFFTALAGTWEDATEDYAFSGNSAWKYWKYRYDDGTYAQDCTVEEDGVTYYFSSPIYSDGKNLDNFGVSNGYGWRNVKKVNAISDEILRTDKKNGKYGGTPIIILDFAAYYQGTVATTSFSLRREQDGSCSLNLLVRFNSERNQKGLRALTYLLCDDDTLYNFIVKDYEEEILIPDTWTPTDFGYSIMVHEAERNSSDERGVTYYVKPN